MTTVQNVRAADRMDFVNVAKSEFVARKRPLSKKEVYRLLLAVLIVVAGVSIIVANEALLGAFMCVLIGGIMLYFGKHMERLQGTLHATEFMNALFSSALGKNNKFCIVVKSDGDIVYLNRPFQAMFPDFLQQSSRNLETLLRVHSVSDEIREKIMAVIKNNSDEKVTLTMEGIIGQLTLMIEPIERPRGFTLIRGL